LEAKKQLEKKLEEKEILIKEIHHRVKNNNQLLMSLLHLQEMKTRSKSVRSLLSKIIERISAISITYNILYLNENLNNINFSNHINNIISNITSSLIDYDDIIIEKNIEENIIIYNINKITSIGLIINELLSNCIKHAFKDSFKDCRNKKIKINLIKNNDRVIFILEDNGIGLPDNFKIKKQTTMGTFLINALASQLNAKIKYESEKNMGTRVTMSFNLE
jgi:two-component system, sensor histidine kinase PdtaS